jgi:Beta-glucosidase (SUN family)
MRVLPVCAARGDVANRIGQVGVQWDPEATSYTYPLSMYGGLYCNPDGSISKPFPDKPYCRDGAGTYIAVNEINEELAICQTVLPGNEAMLIPTAVDPGTSKVLAVPDPNYWAGTAAHFYVNPPGTSTQVGCVWGTAAQPVGNWAPFVAGANQVPDGSTFVTAGINPIYCCEPQNGFSEVDPGFAIRIECPDGGCNGLPCECNPNTMGVNHCSGGTVGAGGAQFCVVNVAAGKTANLVVFSTRANTTVLTQPLNTAAKNVVTSDNALSSSSSSSHPPQSSSSTLSSSSVSVAPTLAANSTVSSPPSSLADGYITIYPSTVTLGQNQGHAAGNTDTPSPVSETSVASTVKATSGSTHLSSPLTGLLLMGVVALGMMHL